MVKDKNVMVSVGNGTTVEVINAKRILEENGITVFVDEEKLPEGFAPSTPVDLYVCKKDCVKALYIIESIVWEPGSVFTVCSELAAQKTFIRTKPPVKFVRFKDTMVMFYHTFSQSLKNSYLYLFVGSLALTSGVMVFVVKRFGYLPFMPPAVLLLLACINIMLYILFLFMLRNEVLPEKKIEFKKIFSRHGAPYA